MTATLDNSKRLYELTGWGDTQFRYEESKTVHSEPKIVVTTNKQYVAAIYTPAYDSDYLLEKLPAKINHDKEDYFLVLWPSGFAEPELWFAAYTDADYVDMPFLANTDTPADALCLLAIKLKEEGVM